MDIEDQRQVIEYIIDGESKKNPYQTSQLMRECQIAQRQTFMTFVQQSTKKLIQSLYDNTSDNDQQQIYSISLNQNQINHLDIYLNRVQQILNDTHKYKPGQKNMFMNQKINLVIFKAKQIRDLVLEIYLQLEKDKKQQDNSVQIINIFINEEVTNLSQQNLYVFEKGLRNYKYIAIVPTYNRFIDQEYHNGKLTVLYQKLYDNRLLFCDYVYECITNKKIKAYLPQQIINIITDIQFYSLSYQQSCRRFNYCLFKHRLMEHRDPQYIPIHQLINRIEHIVKNRFISYPGYKINKFKLIKVILSEKQNYIISDQAINMEITHSKGQRTQQIILQQIQSSLFRNFNKIQQWQKYAKIIAQKHDGKQNIMRQKKINVKNRAATLMGDFMHLVTPKQRLQQKITRIIKIATQKIRFYASGVKWHQFNFDLRIRPEIPRLIKQSVQKQQNANEVLDEATSNYVSHLGLYIDPQQSGRDLYILKTLQLSGLINLPKRQLDFKITNNYFQKSAFFGKF